MRHVLALCVIAAGALQAQARDVSRAIVGEATAAATSGTLDAFRHRWENAPKAVDRRRVALALGTAARLEYRFSEASRLLRMAEGDTLAPDALTARAALERAAVEARQFNTRAAHVLLARARALASRAGSADITADLFVMLVPMRLRTEGIAAALATVDSAARYLLPADTSLRIELRCWRAQVTMRAGSQTALSDAMAGAAAAARIVAPRVEGLCWQTVAQAHFARDAFRDAAHAFGQAADRFLAGRDESGLSVALQWRGYTHRLLGEFDSAQTDYRRAIAAGTTSGNRSPVAWAWLGLSELSLSAAEPVRAAAEAHRGKLTLSAIDDRWGLAAVNNVAGAAAHQLGDLRRAKSQFLEAIAHSTALGSTSDLVDHGVPLIDIERELHGEAAALARLLWLDTVAGRSNHATWPSDRHYHMALLALRRGDGAAAISSLRRYNATSDPRNTSTMNRFDVDARLAEAYSLDGNPERGALMLDTAIKRFTEWRQSISDRALRIASWEERSLDPDRDLGIATIIARAAAAGHDTLAYRLANARGYRDLRVSIVDRDSQRMPSDVLLLQFVTGQRGEPTTLFLRRGAMLKSVALPPVDSLAQSIAALRSLLAGDALAEELSRQLGTQLLGAAFAIADSTTRGLVVSPDGALHGVPWASLLMPDGQRVMDRFSVTVRHSGAGALARGAAHARGSVVAIGVADGVPRWNGRPLDRLDRAEREAQRVAAASPGGRAMTGAAATEHAVKQLVAAPPSILHVAAHAIVDDRAASRAAIVLRAGDGDDGLLEAAEIAALHLPVDLIVLSGCSTASGRVLAAEGVQGLVRPFLDAGARAVIASHWPASDAAAEQIMAWLYEELADGHTTAEALRSAQVRARRAGMPPADWAGWSYVGDPTARVGAQLSVPRDDRMRLALTLCAIAATLLALGWRYRISNRQVALRT